MYRLELLQGTYQEAVNVFLNKYGGAVDDYFSEKSYARFKAGEIKAPTKRKISRTSEGLYCHHIDEDKMIMMASPEFIRYMDIPFDYQRKNRLVYCNLIEHGILHLLIASETYGRGYELGCLPGVGGYVNFIRPNLIQWLIDGVEPKLPWQIACRNAVFMNKRAAKKMIKQMDRFLFDRYPSMTKKELKEGYEAFQY